MSAEALSHPEFLGANIMAILDGISEVLPGGSAAESRAPWLCGICGCLCFHGETCPRCRGDLTQPLTGLGGPRVPTGT